MATFNGNIFGRARKSIGGITFLKSQARTGTQQAARQRVVPKDQKSPAQMSQRDKMKYAVAVERLITVSELKPGWNRAVSKLPPYQSFISYLLKSMDKSKSTPSLGSFLPPVGNGELGQVKIRHVQQQPAGTLDYSVTCNTPLGVPLLGTWRFFVIGREKGVSQTPAIYTQIETKTAIPNVGSDFTLDENPSHYNGCVFIAQYTIPSLTGVKSYSKIAAATFS